MTGVFRTVCFGRILAVLVVFVAGGLVVGIGVRVGFAVIVLAVRRIPFGAVIIVALLTVGVVIVDVFVEHDDFDPRVSSAPKRIGGGDLRFVRTAWLKRKRSGSIPFG